MKIDTLVLGFLDTNCYILTKNDKCIVIDPAADYKKINAKLKGKELVGILVTHHHPDHIGALKDMEKKTRIYDLKEGNHRIGPFHFEVINTKGHTNDSKTYYFQKDNIMFTGDFLFKGTIGRTDLPTGDIREMKKSIELIKKYPDCKIYPGHGESTTLNYEKENNIYF